MPDQRIDATLSGLAFALDEHPLDLNSINEVPELASERAAREGPAAARELLLRWAGCLTMHLRAIDLGRLPVGEDLRDILANNLLYVVEEAVRYGTEAGVSPFRLADEVVAAAAARGRDTAVATHDLISCYKSCDRHELALAMQVDRSRGLPPAQELLDLLDSARRAYVAGRRPQMADLLIREIWPGEPTGLARALVRTLISQARPGELHEALEGVAVSADDVFAWQRLASALAAEGETEQAALAAEVVALREDLR